MIFRPGILPRRGPERLPVGASERSGGISPPHASRVSGYRRVPPLPSARHCTRATGRVPGTYSGCTKRPAVLIELGAAGERQEGGGGQVEVV